MSNFAPFQQPYVRGATSHFVELLFCKCVYYFKDQEFKGKNFSKAIPFFKKFFMYFD